MQGQEDQLGNGSMSTPSNPPTKPLPQGQTTLPGGNHMLTPARPTPEQRPPVPQRQQVCSYPFSSSLGLSFVLLSDLAWFLVPSGPQSKEKETIVVTSDSDEEMTTIEGGTRPSSPRDGDTWTAPEPSASAGPSRTFWSMASWAGLNVEDVRGGPNVVVDVDVTDITRARQALDELEESRRSFAATVRA